MKRPIGLILAAIALGLLAAFTLITAAGFTFAAFLMRDPAAAKLQMAAATPAPPPAFLFAIMLGFAVVTVVIAGWQSFTVYGLFKLRNWARYSILVMGGLLAIFGLISAAGILLIAFSGASLPPNPQVPAHTMQGIMTAIGLFYLCFAALGAWWLVYFNLRSVKLYFLPAYALPYPANPAFPPPPPPTPGRFAHVPTSIVVFGCLYLVSAVICALSAFVTFPVFFMGFTLEGWGTHLLYLGIATLCGLIGWGLLRLYNRARIASYALIAVGVINFIVLTTPWGRARYAEYNRHLYERMYDQGLSLTPTPPAYVAHILIFGLAFSVLFYAVQIWIIERHRTAFNKVSLQ